MAKSLGGGFPIGACGGKAKYMDQLAPDNSTRTEDEFELQFGDIFDQVAAYASGEPIHMINPEVWSEMGGDKPV